jgi:hypothetical protein
MKIKDLKPAGYNPRKISPEKLAALKAQEELPAIKDENCYHTICTLTVIKAKLITVKEIM